MPKIKKINNVQVVLLKTDSECTINGTHKGTCQNMRNCSAAVVGLRDGIRPVMCSFEGTEPIVCCESKIGSIIEIKEPLVKETGISGRSTY